MIGYKSRYWEIPEDTIWGVEIDITAFREDFRYRLIQIKRIYRTETKNLFEYTITGQYNHNGVIDKSNLFRSKSSAIREMKRRLKVWYEKQVEHINELR